MPPSAPHDATLDVIAIAISVSLFLGYQMFLALRLRRDPVYTVQAATKRARVAWVGFMMEHESRALLAVQTLRNSTMAATFFASTAVLLMIGVLNMAAQSDKLIAALHLGDPQDILGSTLWTVKLLLLVSVLFVAFFSFALAVRMFNHVGYLIVQASLPLSPERSADTTARYMTRAGTFYTIGMRAYYLVVPLVFWLFGPELLVVSSIVLVLAVSRLDRAAGGSSLPQPPSTTPNR